MKALKATLGILIFGSMICCATAVPKTGTIVSDCTGKYLRIEGKDYLVCNTDLIKNYREGTSVTATFEKIEKCPEFDGKIACMMYHENEGLIRIKSIK